MANQSAHALSWTWSLVDTNGQTSSGTFTTNGTSYQTGTTYTITGITGTSNINATGKTIAAINGSLGAPNLLQWDGTNSSPIITNGGGISWDNTDGKSVNIYYNNPNPSYFSAVNSSLASYPGNNLRITSSTLTPPVPFEFSPEQGFILGIPLFLGLRKLKKKRA